MIERFMTAEPGAGWVFIIGAIIIVLVCLVVGERLHRTIHYAFAEHSARIPPDFGAWIGLLIGITVALLV